MKLAVRNTPRVQGVVGHPDIILAQDLHPRVRAIVAHWATMGQQDRLPGRQHLDPRTIPRLLPNVWLVDVERSRALRFRYRLAGTRITRAFSEDPTGRHLDEVHQDFGSNGVARYLEEVVETGLASWRSGKPAFWELHDFTHIERVYLPLAADGETVDMILAFSIFLDRFGVEF
ncbi:hypothetical protein ABIE65_001907 [Constrictibacter sp. MBR-5]|jgi:hypothetical protein|uniref:PAS domain-containing protein n=1 Tax=Constrictibacter sp. MBR-5 TaxID=3156467 RepID=UPI0033947CC2